ncbi:MAG: AAA family ATPase [Deltaproteobacteria bacterium]|nr:AAA family ATPase [Deltaproteobacteria bacterium]
MLPPLIQALLDPLSYPERPAEVNLRQTHISYLFFTPDFVYKVKKSVNFGFLDFTSLYKRLFYCNEELRLNRRLAPGVYIGVAGITYENGQAKVGGEGEPVEYAVKMKRLPEASILEKMLEEDKVTEKEVIRIAEKIAEFHKDAQTNERISSFGLPQIIRNNTEENFIQTIDAIDMTISKHTFDRIKEYTHEFISKNERLFLKRAKDGFIKDCHGDIHCEHISIADGINLIDCIEFNERFRFSDTVADIAFFSMDLDYHNRADLSRLFDSRYFSLSKDTEGVALLDFYKCYRAYVRGKVAGFKSFEPEVTDKEKGAALLDAKFHFHLSKLYATGGFRPALIIIMGLSGTGKTTIAEELSRDFSLIRLSSDSIRKELAGIPIEEKRIEEFKKGIYSEEFTNRTYRALIERGITYLKNGRSVILDATFSKQKHIEELKTALRGITADFHIIRCAAGDDAVKERILGRCFEKNKAGTAVSDADWQIYLKQKASFEPVTEPHLTVNSELPVNESVAAIIGKIFD